MERGRSPIGPPVSHSTILDLPFSEPKVVAHSPYQEIPLSDLPFPGSGPLTRRRFRFKLGIPT